jgi:hypothetical protein
MKDFGEFSRFLIKNLMVVACEFSGIFIDLCLAMLRVWQNDF